MLDRIPPKLHDKMLMVCSMIKSDPLHLIAGGEEIECSREDLKPSGELKGITLLNLGVANGQLNLLVESGTTRTEFRDIKDFEIVVNDKFFKNIAADEVLKNLKLIISKDVDFIDIEL